MKTVPSTESTFVDPQGTYEIDVDPSWIAQHGAIAAEIELWFVGPPSGQLATNVNVLTQNAPAVDLRGYLDLSVENADLLLEDGEVVDSGIVQGTYDQLAFMEYRGVQAGNQLHFLGYFTVDQGTAVVATLTSTEDQFDQVRREAEPYLQTLRSTEA